MDLTYLLTQWCRVLPEQLTGLQLVKKFPAFHGTRRFITALTTVRHLSLYWASQFYGPIDSNVEIRTPFNFTQSTDSNVFPYIGIDSFIRLRADKKNPYGKYYCHLRQYEYVHVFVFFYFFFPSPSNFFSFYSIFRTIFTASLHLFCNLFKYRGAYNMLHTVKISA